MSEQLSPEQWAEAAVRKFGYIQSLERIHATTAIVASAIRAAETAAIQAERARREAATNAVLSDMSKGMSARRKGWPGSWRLQTGDDDVLLLTTPDGTDPWAPTQEDLLAADWYTGD